MRTLLLFIITCVGCGPINPEPETDEDGNEIVTPGPFDAPLQIIDYQPAGDQVHPDSDIIVQFDRYVSDRDIVEFSAISLASGGVRARGITTLLYSQRAALFRPNAPLVEGLNYRVVLNPDQFFSETGAPIADTPQKTYSVSSSAEPVAVEFPRITWDDVSEVFDRHCNSCHESPEWQLPSLTPRGLVGVKSAQVDQLLVQAHNPANSYLLHKVLPDFADRRFTVQPPPWSGAAPLTSAQIATIEYWIASGAPGPRE